MKKSSLSKRQRRLVKEIVEDVFEEIEGRIETKKIITTPTTEGRWWL
jgi:hypothetical protein